MLRRVEETDTDLDIRLTWLVNDNVDETPLSEFFL